MDGGDDVHPLVQVGMGVARQSRINHLALLVYITPIASVLIIAIGQDLMEGVL